MEKEDKGISYLYYFKCQNQNCRLEFSVLSWDENWPNQYKPFCPECGHKEASLLVKKTSDRPIYALVYEK
jgi:hypothetical protein